MAKNSKEKQRQYDDQRKDTRGRNWCLIFYPEDLPSDWLELLKTEWQAPMLVSPLHDQDYTAEGKPKKPHYHVIFFFPTLHSGGQLKRELGDMFGTAENGSVIGVANIVSSCLVRNRNLMVRYLAHMDDADKHRYDENDIQGFNGADVTKELVRSQEETQALIVEMEEFIEQEVEDEEEIKIVKTKRFDFKPMDPEEACMQMELLGHSFFVFTNAETDQINVVYKRKNNTYNGS